jgi:DNA polymerase/3'-5' exonuclease PolX
MFDYNRAQVLADKLINTFGLFCQKVIVAGSLRRGATTVKDVEIVALPKYHLDLFGGFSDQDELTPVIRDEMAIGTLRWRNLDSIRNGDHANKVTSKYKYMALYDTHSTIPIDLFIVRPPSNYYWQLMIRTGPADYSKWLVNQPKRFGWDSREGAVWQPNKDHTGGYDGTYSTVDFTSEKHVCETLQIPYIPPRDRR